tara:strand:- start:4421 stop:5488 length:1068 start_codon:yes stop_codon:yes gene_type:complete
MLKSGKNIKNYNYHDLFNFTKKTLIKVGLSNDNAALLSKNLVEANLSGYDSHGLLRLDHYITRFKNKTVKKNPDIKIKNITETIMVTDGDYGFGQIIGKVSMENTVKVAKKYGVGFCSVTKSNHFGRASFFNAIAVKNNMIGISMTHTDANTVPYGGKKPFFGSNVIAFSCPSNLPYPIVIDMSLNKLSYGKIYEAEFAKKDLPKNSVLDKDGNYTTDPKKAEILLPAAEYKGYALSMMIEIFCSILIGIPFGNQIIDMYKQMEERRNLGHVFIAINIEQFRPVDEFKSDIEKMCFNLQNIPRMSEDLKIQIPGEIEHSTMLDRKKNGIPIPLALILQLTNIGKEFGINFPSSLK